MTVGYRGPPCLATLNDVVNAVRHKFEFFDRAWSLTLRNRHVFVYTYKLLEYLKQITGIEDDDKLQELILTDETLWFLFVYNAVPRRIE